MAKFSYNNGGVFGGLAATLHNGDERERVPVHRLRRLPSRIAMSELQPQLP